jgi:hypothetical protein
MNPALLAAGGLGLLVAVGTYQLWAGRLTALGSGGQLMVDDVSYPTRADVQHPRRLLEPRKLANLLTVVCELVVLIVAGVAAAALVTSTTVGRAYAALVVTAYLVGAYLVARAVYVRLGLPTPVAGDAGEPDDVAASLGDRFGDDVATAFSSIHEADATVRAEDDLDDVTAALLAGARTERRRGELATWAAESGLASESTVRGRAEELTECGLFASGERLSFSADQLADADPDEVVAVATSLGA